MGQLFGTDGIRGVANVELTPELLLGLGRAVVRTLKESRSAHPRVAVGRDPRASGDMLTAALVAGITSAGGDAIPLGVVPTPGVALLTGAHGADSGAVLSASHNPVGDNGIKFFAHDGFKLTDAEEERVEELLQRTDEDRPTGTAIGRVRELDDPLGPYLDHLVAAAGDLRFDGLRVVVDCANGAASEVAPEVLRRLGARVRAVHARPDGENINAGCGSTHPEVVARAVVEAGADVGLSFDGDADRLIAADHRGNVVDGDAILAILAADLQAERDLSTVVTTVMTNLGFKIGMRERGIDVVETKVGDRYVLEAMRAGGHLLGGEQSGHLILAEHATTGDGVLSAVRLLATLARTGRSLAEHATVIERLPQVLVNVRDVDRDRLADDEVLWKVVTEEEGALGDSGRVLVRASGTEPLVRVMVEAATEERATTVAERLAEVVAERLRLG
ncbi:MAG: phosphoglucosamine mutase [Actinomycetota bacterium]